MSCEFRPTVPTLPGPGGHCTVLQCGPACEVCPAGWSEARANPAAALISGEGGNRGEQGATSIRPRGLFQFNVNNFKPISLFVRLLIVYFQLVTGAPTTSPGSTGSGSNLSPSCGEGGPGGGAGSSPLSRSAPAPGMTDPMTGQLLDSSLAALSYRGGAGLGGLGAAGMYSTSYPSTEQNPYPSIAMENSAFYPGLVSWFLLQSIYLVKYPSVIPGNQLS